MHQEVAGIGIACVGSTRGTTPMVFGTAILVVLGLRNIVKDNDLVNAEDRCSTCNVPC